MKEFESRFIDEVFLRIEVSPPKECWGNSCKVLLPLDKSCPKITVFKVFKVFLGVSLILTSYLEVTMLSLLSLMEEESGSLLFYSIIDCYSSLSPSPSLSIIMSLMLIYERPFYSNFTLCFDSSLDPFSDSNSFLKSSWLSFVGRGWIWAWAYWSEKSSISMIGDWITWWCFLAMSIIG
jgi:hypothetical protein